MNKKIWKPIKGYEGLYEISNHGDVKALEKQRGWLKTKEIILKQHIDKDGYYKISLCKNNKSKLFFVSRLVAEAFLSKKDFKSLPDEDRINIDLNKLEVNHKDEDKSNNSLGNLEWCTQNYNLHYGNRSEKISKSLGMPVIQYDINWNKINEFASTQEAARITKLNSTHIGECCRKLKYHKTHGGFIWRYKGKEENNGK